MLLTTAIVLTVGSAIAIATGQVDIKTLRKAAAEKATGVKTAAAETAAATKDLAATVVSAAAEKVGEVADKVGGGALSADEDAQVRLDCIPSPSISLITKCTSSRLTTVWSPPFQRVSGW
jgi:predicted TIM-barrel enzyme